MRLFEPALARADRARERPANVAEQLRFEERFGDRAAVDGHKPMVAPRAVVMDRARGELFSSPGFADDQDRARRCGNGLEQLKQLAHDAAAADETVNPIALLELRAQVRVLRPKAPLFDRGGEHVQQRVELERLGDEVGGALLAMISG